MKYTVATPAGSEPLDADAKAAGQRITAFCMINRFEKRPEVEIKWCRKSPVRPRRWACRRSASTSCPVKLARAEFLKLSVETLKKIMAATESTGVAFAIENHGTTTNDPVFLNALFEGVGSKRLGLTLDTGNFYWFGHPLSKVYELYETLAPRVFQPTARASVIRPRNARSSGPWAGSTRI